MICYSVEGISETSSSLGRSKQLGDLRFGHPQNEEPSSFSQHFFVESIVGANN